MTGKLCFLLGVVVVVVVGEDRPRESFRHSLVGRLESGQSFAPSPVFRGESFETSAAAKYSFSYAVKDEESGNDFGHQESRDGDRTHGSYYVLLPDGRKQIVEYYIDGDSGFRSKIRYEGGAGTTRPPHISTTRRPPSTPIHTTQRPPSTPIRTTQLPPSTPIRTTQRPPSTSIRTTRRPPSTPIHTTRQTPRTTTPSPPPGYDYTPPPSLYGPPKRIYGVP